MADLWQGFRNSLTCRHSSNHVSCATAHTADFRNEPLVDPLISPRFCLPPSVASSYGRQHIRMEPV